MCVISSHMEALLTHDLNTIRGRHPGPSRVRTAIQQIFLIEVARFVDSDLYNDVARVR